MLAAKQVLSQKHLTHGAYYRASHLFKLSRFLVKLSIILVDWSKLINKPDKISEKILLQK